MSSSSNSTGKPSGLKKKLLIAAGILLLLPIILYFVLTSSAFIKGFVLPKASQTLNAQITVDDLSVSAFSSVSLRGLKVNTTGEPLLTADAASVHYSLMDIIGGKLTVSELKIQAPTVKIIKNADGTSNLDPIMKALAASTAKPETKPSEPGKKPNLNLKNISLENAKFTFTQALTNGGKQNIELARINLTVDQVVSGISGKLQLGTDVLFEKQADAKALQDRIETKATANFDFLISADLQPQTIKGSAELKVGAVKGAFNDLADLIATLSIDLTPTELKTVKLGFTQKGTSLGALSVSGPFDIAKNEGTLAVNIESIEKQVLNLVGAPMGLDFGNTRLTSANTLKISQGGKQVALNGQFNALKFSVHKGDLTLKPLDLSTIYALNTDTASGLTQIDTFKLSGSQGGKVLLDTGLTEPLKISTHEAKPEIGKSAFYLKVNDLDLADWQAVLGKVAPAGKINVNLSASADNGGQQILADLHTSIAGLKVLAGTNAYENLGGDFKTQISLQNMTNFSISSYALTLTSKKDDLVRAQGRGTINLASQAMQLETTTEAFLAPAITLLHLPDMKLQSGSVKAAINVNQAIANKTTNMTVTGTITLADLSGKVSTLQLNKLQDITELNLELINGQDLKISKLTAALNHAGKPAGSFDLTGTYSLAKSSGKIDYTLTDLNENLLGTLVSSAATNFNLSSISISSKGSAAFDPAASTSLKAGLQIFRLAVSDKSSSSPMQLQGDSLNVDINVNQSIANKSTNLTVTGSVNLAGLSGKVAGIQLNKLQTTVDLGMALANAQDLKISKLTAAVQHAGKPAGSFDLTGTYSLAKSSGKVDYSLTELNENLLSALLAPALTNASLTSISINSKGSAAIDPAADTSIKADLQVSRLVVTDKAGKLPKDPLAIGAKLDASMAKQVLDLKNVQLTLTPTDRAKNEVTLTGKVDTSKTNAITGNVKLSSDGLDFTRYYDLFAGNTAPDKKAAPAPTSAPAADQNKEMDAVTLPVKNFRADIDIKKLYLREIAAEKWLTTVIIDGSRVKVEPLQLTLNNAPVNAKADLDLSVPGFRYDVTAKATKIPLAPIANSFAPEYKDRAAGDLFADINVKGAGTTGKSLQKNLTGNISLNFTNANIQIVEKGKFYPVMSAVALILRVPELLKSPLDAVAANVVMGNGNIDIQSAGVHSPTFIASTAGKITIDNVLTNSPLNLPVDFYLASGLAKHFSITDRSTNNAYVKMPSFLTLKGTLGTPKADIKELVITGLLVKSVGALPVDLGEKGNNILKGVGNILTGQPMTTNAPPQTTTNAPSQTTTNKSPVLDVLDLFKKKK
jgi:hypothetical protein